MRILNLDEITQVSGCGFWKDLGQAAGRLMREFDDDMEKLEDGSPDVEGYQNQE